MRQRNLFKADRLVLFRQECTSLIFRSFKLKTRAQPILFPKICWSDERNIHTPQLVCTVESKFERREKMNNQINWLLHPPVDGPRATILIRVMAGKGVLGGGYFKFVFLDQGGGGFFKFGVSAPHLTGTRQGVRG